MIHNTSSSIGHHHPQKYTQDEAYTKGYPDTEKGPRKELLYYGDHGGTLGEERVAKVSPQEGSKEVKVLRIQRSVKIDGKKRRSLILRILIRNAILSHKLVDVNLNRIPGHKSNKKECQGYYDKNSDKRLPQPPEQIGGIPPGWPRLDYRISSFTRYSYPGPAIATPDPFNILYISYNSKIYLCRKNTVIISQEYPPNLWRNN